MRKLISILLIVFLSSAISFQSCSSCNKKHKKEGKDSAFAKGKVIPGVTCKNDITQKYALYLPSYYSENKKWPVVYAFDSHGKGLIPVELFKEEAEKYGYIIIGSDNSKNGTPWNITSEIYDTLYSDTHRRFSIDNTRIYTAGFSGGSRVASTLAITKGGINAVIGCGAGFGTQEQPVQKFDYFGIAGNGDFNLLEMTVLDSTLEKSGYRHFMEIFDGKHEWPPKSIVSDAFLWLELNVMKDKQKPLNDTLIKNIFNCREKEYKNLSDKENVYDAYLLCKKIVNYFDGLVDVSVFKKDISMLEKNARFIQMQKHLIEIFNREKEQQSYYTNAIFSKDTGWWKVQVGMINRKIKTTADKEEKFMYRRVLNYLSLATYMNTSGALKAKQFVQAENFNTIYALVDPDNPEHAYISATLSMKKQDAHEAIKHLEKVVELGFTEYERLETDTVMGPLKQEEKYAGILEAVKSNANNKQ